MGATRRTSAVVGAAALVACAVALVAAPGAGAGPSRESQIDVVGSGTS